MKPANEHRRCSWSGATLPWVFYGAFLLSAGSWVASVGRGPLPGGGWLVGLALVSAVTATVAGLARNLPIENSLMAALFVVILSSAVEVVGVKTGVPFGRYTFTENIGPRIFHILPWPVPFLWVMIVLNSRGVARLILRPWGKLPNRGLWVIGLAGLLAVLIDFSLEPFAVQVGRFWVWQTPPNMPAWYGVPWMNFPGWVVTAFLVLTFTTPWLIIKKPVTAPAVDLYPLSLWLTLNLVLVAGNGLHGLWGAAGFGLIAGAIVTVLGLRGGAAHSGPG